MNLKTESYKKESLQEEARSIPRDFFECMDHFLTKKKIFSQKSIPLELRLTFL